MRGSSKELLLQKHLDNADMSAYRNASFKLSRSKVNMNSTTQPEFTEKQLSPE